MTESNGVVNCGLSQNSEEKRRRPNQGDMNYDTAMDQPHRTVLLRLSSETFLCFALAPSSIHIQQKPHSTTLALIIVPLTFSTPSPMF